MSRFRFALIAGVVLVAVAAVAFAAAAAQQADIPTATRVALAQVVNPAGARGQTLGLSRVTIPPQARLPLHIHPGTQTAYIEKGTLTYSVKQGVVPVYRGAADQNPRLVRRIRSGQTAKIRRGQWLVERPGVEHAGANLGDRAIVILVATLLENGKPPAIPVTP